MSHTHASSSVDLPNASTSPPPFSVSSVDDDWNSDQEDLSDEFEIDESSDDLPSSTTSSSSSQQAQLAKERLKKHVNKGRWTKDEDEVKEGKELDAR